MNRPNILVILTDQQRHDCLGFAGQKPLKTPHLDALAAESIHFSRTFCTYPVCTPSRYSLLSGLPVRAHAGWTNHCTLASHIATFPKQLRVAGYQTAAVGKMHFAPTYLDVGFDQMQLCEQDGNGRWDDDYHRDLRERDLLDAIDIMDQRSEFRAQAPPEYWDACGALSSNLSEAHHSTTWIAERALEQISNWDEGGNLLMCGFVKPHHPFDPPAPWNEMYDPDAVELLPGWSDALSQFDAQFPGYFPHNELTPEKLKRVTAFYFATISQVDHHIGRIIARLKARGLYDNTVIVFASDHGEYLGFHHLLLKSGPMYDPLMRVPLLIKFANQVGGGTRHDGLTCLTDVAPTLLHAAGVAPPATMKGRDLGAPHDKRQWIFAEDKGGQILMARSPRYKLLWSNDVAQRRFFDLENDPHENRDLIDDANSAATIEQHRAALADWALFEALPPNCLEPAAPLVAGAPNRDQTRQAWSAAKFDEFLRDHKATPEKNFPNPV